MVLTNSICLHQRFHPKTLKSVSINIETCDHLWKITRIFSNCVVSWNIAYKMKFFGKGVLLKEWSELPDGADNVFMRIGSKQNLIRCECGQIREVYKLDSYQIPDRSVLLENRNQSLLWTLKSPADIQTVLGNSIYLYQKFDINDDCCWRRVVMEEASDWKHLKKTEKQHAWPHVHIEHSILKQVTIFECRIEIPQTRIYVVCVLEGNFINRIDS